MAILMTACLSSCSHDNDPDNPYKPDNGEYSMDEYSIPAALLPGEWVLESYTEELSGKKQSINVPFSILPFEIKRTSSELNDNLGPNIWAETYDPLTSGLSPEGIAEYHGSLHFFRPDDFPLNQSKIWSFSLNIPDINGKVHIVVMAHLEFENGKLIGFGSYSDVESGSPGKTPTVATIVLRKI